MRQLLQSGQVLPTDLVWSEGMANWLAANQVPGLIGDAGVPAPAAAAPEGYAPGTSPYYASSPSASYGPTLPQGLLGWTQFVGVMNIIGGVLTCLSCVGIPLGILMIVAGNALLGSRNTLMNMASVDNAMAPYLQQIKKYMLMRGILYIINIILFFAYIVFYAVLITQGFLSFDQMGIPLN
jgi:hypothetical protein